MQGSCRFILISPLHFLCNKEVERGIHWIETPHANSICSLLGRYQGIGAINLEVQNMSRDKNDCIASHGRDSNKL
jgi:hypothetical protein